MRKMFKVGCFKVLTFLDFPKLLLGLTRGEEDLLVLERNMCDAWCEDDGLETGCRQDARFLIRILFFGQINFRHVLNFRENLSSLLSGAPFQIHLCAAVLLGCRSFIENPFANTLDPLVPL